MHHSKFILLLFCTCLFFALQAQENADVSFEQVLSLRNAGSPVISPDGKHIAFTVRSTDWKNNTYDTEIWLAREGEAPFQLTRTADGSSTSPAWSPDGKWIAFRAKRGEKMQIHVIRPFGGEAQAVTNEDENIGSFEWSPDGTQFAFTMQETEGKEDKEREKRFGAYEIDDADYRLSHLWLVDFQPDMMPMPHEIPCYEETSDSSDCITLPKATRLTEGDFTVSNFEWSPDGTKIAITHQPNPLIMSFMKSDISILDVKSRELKSAVSNPSSDSFAAWAPDSRRFVYTSEMDDTTSNFYTNNKVFITNLSTGKTSRVGQLFDEAIGSIQWNASGIFFAASQRTNRHFFQLDPGNGQVKPVMTGEQTFGSYSFSDDGKTIAFSASDATHLSEIYKTSLANFKPKRITDMTQQIADWPTMTSEVIKWRSEDDAEIEGVLHKPQDYDPTKKYPLLVIIHGGPTGVDRPAPVLTYVYPAMHWANKGALILRVNYRGSAGYGEAFRSLNVRNLGVGDMWDVMSGVDYLIDRGMVDENKMGCMGWSQGGYISAFLTTNTDRFQAISVGAGISNWMTYYVNTDIHPFTRQYLQATPWEDIEIYDKTSPMTNINQASTPTLIQHGEFDRRVPIPNAYELLQGLRDQNVPAQLIVYKGFGHGITKPKERLAAVWHNWQWFNKYVWGEEVQLPFEE